MIFPSAHFEAAGYLFERSHGNPLSPYETSVLAQAGLAAAVPDEVAAAIWRTLEQPMPNGYRTTAYFVLGKLARKADLPRFVAALRRETPHDIQVAYQILIALDNLGEPVFSRSGVGCNEDELNRRDALAYLATQR